MRNNDNQQVFFALLRAGLWEKEVRLLPFGRVDYQDVLRLAEEQSVIGLIAAGMEHVSDTRIPKMDLLQAVGHTLQIEDQNKAMNHFIGVLTTQLRNEGISSVLVKGQGIAQCYERPMWRTSGDIDLLLDRESYEKAKKVLGRRALHENREGLYNFHQAITINGWEVELHGTMRTNLGTRIDNELDSIQAKCIQNNEYRMWENEGESIILPSPDNDVVFVFTHILQHFFRGGIGLRQIFDWCRLLWTYREQLDLQLLESRLRRMGLVTEWKAFGMLAVEWLGMPAEAMPFIDVSYRKKARRILRLVMETGNFGHNRDVSYHEKYPFIIYKAISFWQTTKDSCRHFLIFPKDSIRIWWRLMVSGMGRAVRGIT